MVLRMEAEMGNHHTKEKLGTGRPKSNPAHFRGQTVDELRDCQEPEEEELMNRLDLVEEVGLGGWEGSQEIQGWEEPTGSGETWVLSPVYSQWPCSAHSQQWESGQGFHLSP